MVPRGDTQWDVHTSYHIHGQLYIKSRGHKTVENKVQPLTGTFQGTVDLGIYGGHGPKGVGAVCDPGAFNGVVEVEPGVLGPGQGSVAVELQEPGFEPTVTLPLAEINQRKVFTDFVPSVAITIWADNREGRTVTTATDTTQHAPGPLCIFRPDHQTGLFKELTQVEPGESFYCGRRISRFILGAPDDLVLCKNCAVARGYIW